MTEQQKQLEEIRKLKEGIAKCLYEFEYSSGYWDTRMSVGEKVKWIAEADYLLRTILSGLYLDTGELTDEEIRTTVLKLFEEFGTNVPSRIAIEEYIKDGAKAARAKFVSIGEIVK